MLGGRSYSLAFLESQRAVYLADCETQGVEPVDMATYRERLVDELLLFRAAQRDRSPAGARDCALLAILFSAGLRRSELVALDLEDYIAQTGELKVRKEKGGKPRNAWLYDTPSRR